MNTTTPRRSSGMKCMLVGALACAISAAFAQPTFESASPTAGSSTSQKANEGADKAMYKEVQYTNAGKKGPALVVIPGEVKSNNATFTQKFGPLDWRHASAHALYWSALGIERSLARVNRDNKSDFDFVNADRIVIQSVQDLFRSGLIFYDINNPTFILAMPHVDFIDSYGQYRDESNERGGVFASAGA